ncbi:hypothetical protein FOZ63_016595 [Perkinsus olseni]|uniref:Uncharacterized protein n=1 Tax=Perkinsus olseni TaxID=32597 RepID=A0A7J6TTU7_PEROL|nr:hypothetical protein FOZ63_016595 [Perkinsus olseni]
MVNIIGNNLLPSQSSSLGDATVALQLIFLPCSRQRLADDDGPSYLMDSIRSLGNFPGGVGINGTGYTTIHSKCPRSRAKYNSMALGRMRLASPHLILCARVQ